MKKFKFNKVSIIVLAVVFTLSIVGIVKATSPAESPSLGDASSFSILAKTAITNVPTSSISGDVGLDNAGSNYGAGLTSAQVTGTIYDRNGTGPDAGLGNNPTLMTSARLANKDAFLALSADPNTTCGNGSAGGNGSDGIGSVGGINWTTLTPGTIDLSGKTLVPGIYCAGAFTLSGTLTLDDSAGANGIWIFRSAATLVTTGSTAKVVFSDGLTSSACNVWWKVVSSATIGTYTNFIGNILAQTDITMATGATLIGRLFAYDAAVTLDHNTISGCGAPLALPLLTLNKTVVGGSRTVTDFTLTATGTTTTISGITSAPAITDAPVATGSYDLTETTRSYYTGGLWTCTGGVTPVGNTITLANDDDVTCSITNTYHTPSSSGSIARVVAPVFSPSINIISTPIVVAPIIPKLPKTGFPPQEKSAMFPIVLLSGLSLVSIFLYFAQKKQTT